MLSDNLLQLAVEGDSLACLALADHLEEDGLDQSAADLRGLTEKSFCHVRWLIKMDLPSILAAEATRQDPWSESLILDCLKKPNGIGMVAEHDTTVVGYIVYDFCTDHYLVRRLTTLPEHRRTAVALFKGLKSNLHTSLRHKIVCRNDCADFHSSWWHLNGFAPCHDGWEYTIHGESR